MAAIVLLLLRLLGVIFIFFDFREILKVVTVFISLRISASILNNVKTWAY